MKAEFDASNFLNKIKTISKRLEEVSGENTIPFNLLFNEEFLKEYSRFSSIDELFDASGFEINGCFRYNATPLYPFFSAS